MKKLIYLFALILLAACATENQEEITQESTTADKVLAIMDMKPDAEFDNSESGLFKGIIASYDLKTKGTLVINTTEKGGLVAAASLHKVNDGLDRKLIFNGIVDPDNNKRYIFTSDRGTFEVELNKEGRLYVDHFNLDGTDSYVVAYKRSRGVDVSLAMGTFDDDYGTPGGFEGNWDVIHRGSTYLSPAGEHSTFPTILLMIDEIVITQGSNTYFNQDGTQNDDSFTEPCVYFENFPHAWFFDDPAAGANYREFIGYNQTTTFAGRVATWTLAYYFFEGVFYYDTPTCFQTTGNGTFSWDGNTGEILVDTLSDI